MALKDEIAALKAEIAALKAAAPAARTVALDAHGNVDRPFHAKCGRSFWSEDMADTHNLKCAGDPNAKGHGLRGHA